MSQFLEVIESRSKWSEENRNLVTCRVWITDEEVKTLYGHGPLEWDGGTGIPVQRGDGWSEDRPTAKICRDMWAEIGKIKAEYLDKGLKDGGG